MTTNQSIQLDIYINYPRHCEAAFKFYEQYLGGKISMMRPHQYLAQSHSADGRVG